MTYTLPNNINFGYLKKIYGGHSDSTPHDAMNLNHVYNAYYQYRGGLLKTQIQQAMKYTCADEMFVYESEYMNLIAELERRYYIIREVEWEFKMLDYCNVNNITLEDAKYRWLAKRTHGKFFSEYAWDTFLSKRTFPLSRVTFEQLQIFLCSIPSYKDHPKKVKKVDPIVVQVEEHIPVPEIKEDIKEKILPPPNGESDYQKSLREKLQLAIESTNESEIQKCVKDCLESGISKNDQQIEEANLLLKQFDLAKKLRSGIDQKSIKILEDAIDKVRHYGLENNMSKLMEEAINVLMQLRRLERIRAEILKLTQPTVAEIKSYNKPPEAVHQIMIATFTLLGHSVQETKIWKTVQALISKTGKMGLKRRCLGCEPDKLLEKNAIAAKKIIIKYDLDEIRDVSAGTATFYLWVNYQLFF
ncbi:hypothetical protein A3Q56_02029 [Intoshia linei]|uniref:Uncharacterized protein n=1 Tax=Intoshia linei TaxID=1819745 RepID=A0A177B7W0_9BILA|nr:hypothetical protein A3Q56_02029 [Intoshia linei]